MMRMYPPYAGGADKFDPRLGHVGRPVEEEEYA
jgi:hypothetical protein